MPVLINLGRLLMLGVWAFLLLNLVHPFPRPMNIFVNVALIFTSFMHALQMVMLKNGLPKDGPQMTGWQQLRVFIFGVFELLESVVTNKISEIEADLEKLTRNK